jgi:hypothetical protein
VSTQNPKTISVFSGRYNTTTATIPLNTKQTNNSFFVTNIINKMDSTGQGKQPKPSNEAVPIFLRSESCLIDRIKDFGDLEVLAAETDLENHWQ